jgi:hypothetical protein
MEWMDKEDEKYRLVVLDCWTIDEMARARWLPLLYTADYVDVDDRLNPFNKYHTILCQTCGRFDDTIVPVPYKIRDIVLRKKADVFPAFNGLLIVRQRVKNLLLEQIGDQIDCGTTCCVNSSGKRVASESAQETFFWVRPKRVIGADLEGTPSSPCPECGTPRTCPPQRDSEAKIWSDRVVVENFGMRDWNIACIGKRHVSDLRTIVMSGGLWAYLYTCGVKGLGLPDRGLYSKRDEPPVESERRFANLKIDKKDKFLRMKMWWQKEKR